ncbi:MAG: A/G-specific adenine glycosylase [Deltaproteobacteria bacterium]|nr:A/G-specific adenine glycosylase [Deltaproteobacteria bacterium]
MSSRRPPSNLKGLRSALLGWYRENKRDLPWRHEVDAYRVWVSEIMLQQTRVDTVLPYYAAFVGRWPDVRTLAAAAPDEVRAVWSGLGYYRRARLMLQAAETILRVHEGRLPSSAAELKTLPGFGRYTAGAVASIAFAEETPAVDGNVERVLARIQGLETDPKSAPGAKTILEMAQALVRGEAPGDLNQAIMELGALVCTPRSPKCDVCPVAGACEAHQTKRTHVIPPPRLRKTRPTVKLTAVVIIITDDRSDGVEHARATIVLERQPEDGLFAGLHAVPLLPGHLSATEVTQRLAPRFGWATTTPTRCTPTGNVKHMLTHRTLDIDVMRVEPIAGVQGVAGEKGVGKSESWETKVADMGLKAVPLDALDRVGVPSATVRVLRAGLPAALRSITRFPGRRTVTVASPQSPRKYVVDEAVGPQGCVHDAAHADQETPPRMTKLKKRV